MVFLKGFLIGVHHRILTQTDSRVCYSPISKDRPVDSRESKRIYEELPLDLVVMPITQAERRQLKWRERGSLYQRCILELGRLKSAPRCELASAIWLGAGWPRKHVLLVNKKYCYKDHSKEELQERPRLQSSSGCPSIHYLSPPPYIFLLRN